MFHIIMNNSNFMLVLNIATHTHMSTHTIMPHTNLSGQEVC
jgi:hypothetical protein